MLRHAKSAAVGPAPWVRFARRSEHPRRAMLRHAKSAADLDKVDRTVGAPRSSEAQGPLIHDRDGTTPRPANLRGSGRI